MNQRIPMLVAYYCSAPPPHFQKKVIIFLILLDRVCNGVFIFILKIKPSTGFINASGAVFFFPANYWTTPRKSDSWEISEISSASNFVLRPFQKKNPREKTKISARCARWTQQQRRKKQEEKFFDSRIVGPKAPQGCFSPKSVFLYKFSKIHVDLHSKMWQLRNQKVVPAVTVDEKNTGPKPVRSIKSNAKSQKLYFW